MRAAPQLWQDLPKDAGFLCDKAAVLGVTIKEPAVTTVLWSISRVWNGVVQSRTLRWKTTENFTTFY